MNKENVEGNSLVCDLGEGFKKLSLIAMNERLPLEVWENIFLRLKYEKIAEIRLVCKQFNEICKTLLVKGRSKVVKKLDQQLELARNNLMKFGYEAQAKYNFVYFVYSSRDILCNLFREFIGKYCKNAECFTLGKMIDLLRTFLVLLNDDEECGGRFIKYLSLLKFWRKTYDKSQMKLLGEFDYCLMIWIRFGETCAFICGPALRLLDPESNEQFEENVEYIQTRTANQDICTFNYSYNHRLKVEDRLAGNEESASNGDFYDDGDDDNYDYDDDELCINEHWNYYVPPPMDEDCVSLFRKHLLLIL